MNRGLSAPDARPALFRRVMATGSRRSQRCLICLWTRRPASFRQTGAWFLPDSEDLPAPLEEFLRAGSAPVYIGFGSMPDANPLRTTRRLLAAVKNARPPPAHIRAKEVAAGQQLAPRIYRTLVAGGTAPQIILTPKSGGPLAMDATTLYFGTDGVWSLPR